MEFEKKIESLEAKYDGSDGRPKFDKKSVLEFGMKNQVFNPEVAYKELNAKALEEWSVKKAVQKPGKSTYFEKRGGAGSKQPDVKTPTNFKEATEAAMSEE